VPPEVPLPWERLLWSGRPLWRMPLVHPVRYALTDFRLVRIAGARTAEIALHDVGEIRRLQTRLDRLLGTSTIRVDSRRPAAPPILLTGVRRAASLAALIELLSGDPRARLDGDGVEAALAWDPRPSGGGIRHAVASLAVLVIAVFAVASSYRGAPAHVGGATDDPIYANGAKRSRAAIVRFMETDVMPWARATLGPLEGGSSRVTCET
jgi:hypothetical protein